MWRADSKRGIPVLLGSSAFCTALWLLSINGGIPPGTLFWDNVHWTLSAAVATWMVLAAMHRTGSAGALRRTRIWFAATMLANLGGSIIYDVECAVGYHDIPGYNVILFVLLGPCLLLGFVEQLREKSPGAQRRVVLIDLGCAIAQGYAISEPLAPEEFESFVTRSLRRASGVSG